MRVSDPVDDDLLARVREARPELALDPAAADAHVARLLDAILTRPSPVSGTHRRNRPAATRRTRRRVAVGVCATVAAAAIAGVVVAQWSADEGTGLTRAVSTAPVALSGVRLIADRSSAALGGTGRAEITFVTQPGDQRGTTDLSFSGPDLEMTIHFGAGPGGRPGFDARNMTVGGAFYLYDGPPGTKRWYHDTNSSTTRSSDLFDTDPRGLLRMLAPGAGFVSLGRSTVDGTPVTHLRATKLDALPTLNLSLGPIAGPSITALDLWVGGDDVVRRLDLETETKTQVVDPKLAPKLSKDPSGRITAIYPDGHQVELGQSGTLNEEDLVKGLPHTTRVDRSSYSVRFFDVGAPITITAPPDPIPIAAVG